MEKETKLIIGKAVPVQMPVAVAQVKLLEAIQNTLSEMLKILKRIENEVGWLRSVESLEAESMAKEMRKKNEGSNSRDQEGSDT